MTPSGYILVTTSTTEEITHAVCLKDLNEPAGMNLERFSDEVAVIPWCATVADTLEELQKTGRRVATVVNEFGETVGILTFDDILDTVFTREPTRSGRLSDRTAIQDLGNGI